MRGLESEGCFDAVRSLLETLGIRWALAGAIAAGFYRATQRPTTDVDFLVAWDPQLVARLVGAGFDVRVFEDQGEAHLVRARRMDCLVDLIVTGTDYQERALDRARDHVLTVEDVLIHKLIAWRTRDQNDIRSILSTGGAVDKLYVDRWAAEWGVADRWREAQAW
ncbi:MAG TPA: hypothetical protein VIX84_05125 [Acidimicrobiales bacterium]